MTRAKTLGATVIAIALACADRVRSTEGGDGGSKLLMKDLSSAFEGLGKALHAMDAALAGSRARELVAASSALAPLEPQKNREIAAGFRALEARLGELSTEVSLLVEKGDLRRAGQALEEVREACVTCHAKFRASNSESGLFPARGNSVLGSVRLFRADGEERSDRSNVVVFLEGGPAASPRLLRKNPVLSQRGRRFSPRVLPVVRGTTVEFPNDDTIFHNVFSLCQACPFDLDIYEPGKSKSVTLGRTGLVNVYCNIHPDMAAVILVLPNERFALTDELGNFVITGLPDGSYTLRTWSELGGEIRREIVLSEAAVLEVTLEATEKKTSLAHRNKFGKPYAEGYR